MSSATVTCDSELMWNLLPAVAIPSQSKFLTARDRNNNPMVFGIGTDGILRVAQEDPTTRLRHLRDVRASLGIPTDAKIKGFDIYQSSADLIYISVAYSTASESRLLAAKPFDPRNVDLVADGTKLPVYRTVRLDSMEPSDVTLGAFMASTDDDYYPPIILTYLNTATNSGNVKHYEIINDNVVNQGDLSLPVNTSAIVQVAPGKVGRHVGVFVLYDQTAGGTKSRKLMFTSWSDQFDNLLSCPPNAGFILTLATASGSTDLIVGGDGIWHFAFKDILADGATSKQVCDGSTFQGITDMHLSRHGDIANIWCTTGAKGVSYVELNTSGLKGTSHPPLQGGVPLLPPGSSGGIAGFTGPDGRTAVLTSDLKNSMSYLEQSPDTKMWEETPFWFPSPENTIQIHSYITRVVAHDSSNAVIPGALITIAATSWVDVVVNGAPMKMGIAPVTLKADQEGSLTIITPTTDISMCQFAISAVCHADDPEKNLLPTSLDVKTTTKVNSLLSNASKETLVSAQTADGESVFKGMSDHEFEQAAGALKAMHSTNASLDEKGGVSLASNQGFNDTQHVQTMSVSMGASTQSIGQKIKDVFWDCWHFVVKSAKAIGSWAIQTYNQVKAFVITIGETAYRFVIETAQQIAKAVNFIYTEYLKAPFERLVDWLQNLFSWKDVVETKNNIADFINATLDYGSTNLDWAAATVDSKVTELETLIRQRLGPGTQSDTVLNKEAGPKQQDDVPNDLRTKNEQASVKQNWTKYQLTHGGGVRGAEIEGAASGVLTEYQETWETIIKPVFESLSKSTNTILDDIVELFGKTNSLTPAQILQKLGVDTLIGIVDCLKTLIVGLLKRLSLVVADFKELINKKIKVPIFGDLWVVANKIFNKDVEAPTFTVLGFISFILAIPITWTCKLFTGNKPPSPPKMNVKTLSQFFDNSASAQDQASYNGFTALLETGASSTLAVVGLASVVGAGGILAKVFDFQLLLGLVRVAVCIPTKRDLPLWEVRCAISAADATNCFVLAIARKVDSGGKSEQVLAGIEGGLAALNIALATAVNIAELVEEWAGKDETRTTYQILISVLGGASTIGKSVATISEEPVSKAAGVAVKQVAGKASTFFSVINTYSNIGKGKYTYILNSGS